MLRHLQKLGRSAVKLTESADLDALAQCRLRAPAVAQAWQQSSLMSTRTGGTVKWFNPAKGFGFISPNDGSTDVFVHHSSIEADGYRSLQEGEPVEFIYDDTDGRRKASSVTGPDGAHRQRMSFVAIDASGRCRPLSPLPDIHGSLCRLCIAGARPIGVSSRDSSQGRDRESYGNQAIRCFECGEDGHISRQCPNRGNGAEQHA